MEPHGVLLTVLVWGMVIWDFFSGRVRLGGLYRGRKLERSEKPRLYWLHVGVRTLLAVLITLSFLEF